MASKPRAQIIGTGSFVPERRLTNADFEKMVDTTDEWITSRTGIKERRVTDDSQHSSDMAVAAGRRAMEMAGVSVDEVDLVIVGTVTPDYRLPATATLVQEKLNLTSATAFDIVAACTGFITGMSIAVPLIETGRYSTALVVGVEKLTSIVDYNDRNTCVLFGDAAGAAIIRAGEGTGTAADRGVLGTFMRSNGKLREWLWTPTGGTVKPYTRDFTYDGSDKILMNGSEVFKVAVKQMGNAAVRVLADAGLTSDDVAMVVPHQANIRIIEALAKRLNLGMDRVYVNIEKYGNTSAASVPLALDEAYRGGYVKQGDVVLMVAFGAGLIWGAAAVRL